MLIVEADHVWKEYSLGEERVIALRDVTLRVEEGEFVTIVGRSGSGKSTLLHLIGLLDTPTRGQIRIRGRDVSRLPDSLLSAYRGRMIGFVFQTFNLLPTLTAWENVALPLRIVNVPERDVHFRVRDALERVNMLHRAWHTPHRLSGGERQRIAIARAIVHDPLLIVADEPTGNLDSENGLAIVRLFLTLHEEGRTILLVTHDPDLSRVGTRRVVLKDGRIIREEKLSERDRREALRVLAGRE